MDSDRKILRDQGRAAHPRSPKKRDELSRIVVSRIETTPQFREATRVALYYPRVWEVDLLSLWEAHRDKCYFPRCERASFGMSFHRVSALSELRPGFGGIPEPDASAPRAERWEESDLVLVPGLRFDRSGGRLGSGLGFYDRFLAALPARRWGVCWDAQLVDTGLPQGPNDVSMGAVCTEKELIVCEA